MRIVWLVAAISMLLFLPFGVEAGKVSGEVEFGTGTVGYDEADVPVPMLLSPVGNTVDLTGEETLEFKWSPFEGRMYRRQGYDFRLYKGRQTYASDEIYKEQVGPDAYHVVLKADMFEDGQVYTWTLRQLYFDNKSDAAYNSFKVVKKKEN
jgi:hypothetical protein